MKHDRPKSTRAPGETATRAIFPYLNSASKTAPTGELSQFSALAVANQYRTPYAVSLRHVSRGATVLDWGCGDGHFSYFLLDAGYSVVSFSLQHQPHVLRDLPAHLSQRFHYVQGQLSEPTRLPFPEASFDAVFSVGVLEHVRELGGTEVGSLLEIRRVLRPEGYFLCFHLPNRYSYIEALARRLRRNPGATEGSGFHRFRFSTRDVFDLCSRAGLKVASNGRYAFLPRNVLARLPQSLGDSWTFTKATNLIDDGLGTVFNVVCQNHFFVARPDQLCHFEPEPPRIG